MICTPHRAVSWDQMKNGVGGHVARVGEKCIVWWGNLSRKTTRKTPGVGGNTKMDLKKLGWERVDWMHLRREITTAGGASDCVYEPSDFIEQGSLRNY